VFNVDKKSARLKKFLQKPSHHRRRRQSLSSLAATATKHKKKKFTPARGQGTN
jgi:hypothetical protein